MENESYVFVLGARAISGDKFDLHFDGVIAGAVLLSSAVPEDFSACVLSCLESLQANTSGTAISSLGFNTTSRTLRLVGRAPPMDYQLVLRRLVYTNRASSLNIDSTTITLDDGVSTTTLTSPVTQASGRRRRATLARRRLHSLHPREETRVQKASTNHQIFLSPTFLLAVLLGAFVLMIIMIIISMLWKRKQHTASSPLA